MIQNVRVIADFPSEYFQVHTSTANGTHHYVRTLKRGITFLEGQLKAVILQVAMLNLYFHCVFGNNR